jgi:hypothetical protein
MVTINEAGVETVEEQVSPVTVVINEAVGKGFDLIFRLKEDGSLWDQNGIYYNPAQMKIAYKRIFEGNPDDGRSIRATTIYLLRNDEGDKGILVDADGIYEDSRMVRFTNEVEKRYDATRERKLQTKNKLMIAAAGLLLIGSVLTFKLISSRK